MLKRFLVIPLLLLFCVTPLRALAGDDPATLARKGFDRVLNLDMVEARKRFAELAKVYPDYPFTHFLKASVDWAEAEVTRGKKRAELRERAVRSMEAAVELADRRLADPATGSNTESNDLWQLTRGMARFFAGRLYADTGHSFKAYRQIRKARDDLEQLIARRPDMHDAYLVLGMYEYLAGSVPRGMRWLASLLDLRGNLSTGVRYLEIASAKAPVMAPEAARMLLIATAAFPETTRGCAYRSMSKYARNKYPKNPHFSVALQLMYVNCGQPVKALAENRVAEKQFLQEFPELNKEFRMVRFAAWRDQGKLEAVRGLKDQFRRDPDYWKLVLAQTLDVVGDRGGAMALYNEIYWSDIEGRELQTHSGPPADWLVRRAAEYRKHPYAPPKASAPINGEALYLHAQVAG